MDSITFYRTSDGDRLPACEFGICCYNCGLCGAIRINNSPARSNPARDKFGRARFATENYKTEGWNIFREHGEERWYAGEHCQIVFFKKTREVRSRVNHFGRCSDQRCACMKSEPDLFK